MIPLMELKRRAKELKPTVQIGKYGLTGEVLKEINKQLKDKKLIKIRLQRAFVLGKSRKEIAEEIANKTNARIVSIVGNTISLFKE